MKIIEYGYINPIPIFCNYCGCSLEYTIADEQNLHGSVYVKCLVCGRYIYTREA